MLRMVHTNGRQMMAEPTEVYALKMPANVSEPPLTFLKKLQGDISNRIINIVTGQLQDAKIWFKLDATNPSFIHIFINDLASRLRVVEI